MRNNGDEEKKKPPTVKTIRFKQIKAVYEKFTITEKEHQYLKPFKRFNSPEQVFNTFNFLQSETKEYFLALHLDVKNRICCVDQIAIGSLSQAVVHPREVFKTALLSAAASIILLHNHPSGDPTPSREDIAITDRLIETGELIGVKVLDHIIIGDTYVSFAEQDLLKIGD